MNATTTMHPDKSARRASCKAPNRLLCYTIGSSQSRYLTHDVPNPHYFCQLYVCASSLREMAALINRHVPNESVTVVDIATCARHSWPWNMRHVKKARGVWASKHASGASVYRMDNGVATLLDD